MAEPPPSRTDEWARVISKAQASAARSTRPRRISDELDMLRAGRQWRQVPLTVGALVAVVSLLVGMAAVYRGYYADVREIAAEAVRQHDGAASAHQSIQAAQRAEWAAIRAELGRINDKLDAMNRASRRRRR